MGTFHLVSSNEEKNIIISLEGSPSPYTAFMSNCKTNFYNRAIGKYLRTLYQNKTFRKA